MPEDEIKLEVIAIYEEQDEALVGYWIDGIYYQGTISLKELSALQQSESP